MPKLEKNKHIGLRIDEETHSKFKCLCQYEGRTINGQILYLIRQAIVDFEKKHGELK